MKKIKILFAEDHEMIRAGIKLMLTNQKSFQAEVTEAANGVEALHLATKYKYDLFLLDISLPLKDGIEVTKSLVSKLNNPKIIALTLHREDFVVKQILDAGALGYVLKSSGIEDLTKAILTVLQGKRYFSEEISQMIFEGRDTFADKNTSDKLALLKKRYKLSPREAEVLKYISDGCSDRQIAEKFGISIRTAGNHRYNICKKMEVNSSVELASIALKQFMV